MKGIITIKPHIGTNPDGTKYKTGLFDVSNFGKKAVGLTFDETLGLTASIAMPENRPCKQWLKTPAQIKARDERFNKQK